MLNGLDKIEGLTPEQQTAINGLATGLSTKNTELLDKLSNNRTAGEESTAELTALKQFKENVDIQAAEDAKNWKEADRLRTEAHQTQLDKLTGQLTDLTQRETKLLIEDGLHKALDAMNVNPSLKQGAEAILRSQAIITDGKAMIGEKSLSEAVKEWADSDAGKAFCLAPSNNNGDANGSGGNGSTSFSSDKAYADMTIKEQVAHNTNINPLRK